MEAHARKYIAARLLADDPSEVDRRFFKPFPLQIPPDELPQRGGSFQLRQWQHIALQQLVQNQSGQFHMQAGAGKKTLIVKICEYSPRSVPQWPDFRILVLAKDRAVLQQIHGACAIRGLDVALIDGRATSFDEESRIWCCTARSIGRAGGVQFDAMLAWQPQQLITAGTYEMLFKVRAYRKYAFCDVDELRLCKDAIRLEGLNLGFGPVLVSRDITGLVPGDRHP